MMGWVGENSRSIIWNRLCICQQDQGSFYTTQMAMLSLQLIHFCYGLETSNGHVLRQLQSCIQLLKRVQISLGHK